MNEFGTQLAAGDETGIVVITQADGKGSPVQLADVEIGLGQA